MAIKKCFVILQEQELKMKITPGAKILYLGIKSFLGNGKIEKGVSPTEIAERLGTSRTFFYNHIKEVLEKTPIEVCGHEKKVGGEIEVYRIKSNEIRRFNDKKVYQEQTLSPQESVTQSDESVKHVGTKPIQSKKEAVSKQKTIISQGHSFNWVIKQILAIKGSSAKEEKGELFVRVAGNWDKVDQPWAYLNAIKKNDSPSSDLKVKSKTASVEELTPEFKDKIWDELEKASVLEVAKQRSR